MTEENSGYQKLHKLFADNLHTYNFWWENRDRFIDVHCLEASPELNAEVLELTNQISLEEATRSGVWEFPFFIIWCFIIIMRQQSFCLQKA